MQGLSSRNAGSSESECRAFRVSECPARGLPGLDPSQARQGIQKHWQVTQQEAESSLVTVTGSL